VGFHAQLIVAVVFVVFVVFGVVFVVVVAVGAAFLLGQLLFLVLGFNTLFGISARVAMAAASVLDEETAAKVLRQVGGCTHCTKLSFRFSVGGGIATYG